MSREFGHFTPIEVVPDPFAVTPLPWADEPTLPDPFAVDLPGAWDDEEEP